MTDIKADIQTDIQTDIKVIDLREHILSENNEAAQGLRDRLHRNRVMMINVMAAPGAGKTSLILQAIAGLKDRYRLAVIEGDIESTVDSEKIRDAGVQAVQINTGGACHLDAPMIEPALAEIPLETTDLIFVENIGNLVCPAEFDIGESLKMMVLSVPEGDDKVLKYPLMFSVCDVLLINKTDYLQMPGCNFDMAALERHVRRLNPNVKIFHVSAYTGAGIEAWIEDLDMRLQALKK